MRRIKEPTVVLSNRQKNLRLDRPFIRRMVGEILGFQSSKFRVRSSELSFVFVGDTEMAVINARFLNHHGPTDVITFQHGEIVISVERAIAQAKEFRSPLHEELTRYMIHGLLHLAGYDDTAPSPRRVLRRRQEQILAALRKKLDLKRILR